jgi:hypothetical protein
MGGGLSVHVMMNNTILVKNGEGNNKHKKKHNYCFFTIISQYVKN